MQNMDKKQTSEDVMSAKAVSAEAVLTKMVESSKMQNILSALKQEGSMKAKTLNVTVLSTSKVSH